MTNPAPKSGMPKWLIILLVILLVIVLGCCGGFAACTWMCHRAVQNAPSLINLATQRAAENGDGVDTSGQGLAVPKNFPADIPLYSGLKIRAFHVPSADQGTITLNGKATLGELKAYYQAEMEKNGWKTVNTSSEEQGTQYSFTKENRTASVMLTGGDPATVTIVYAKN